MGLHRRLFGSFSLSKSRYNAINNPFYHISKQTRCLIHDNSTSKSPNTFLLKRLFANNTTDDTNTDCYLSVFSMTNRKAPRRISLEKNLYLRSPAPHEPTCPFAVIGTGNNNTSLSTEDILRPTYYNGIVGCCDGLICLQSCTEDGTVLLWNPLTNDTKVLDSSSVRRPRGATKTTFKWAGFGFDSESKDYKVVTRVGYEYEPSAQNMSWRSESRYEVYSLKTGSWWPLLTPEVQPCAINHFASVYVDGFYYWAAHNSISFDPNFILSFNFANEKFSFFQLPETGKPIGPYTYNLVEYEGLLGFVLYPEKGGEKNFEVWVREKGETWSKVTSFCVPGAKKPLAYSSKDKWFFEGINHELLLFDLNTMEVEHLDIYDYPGIMELVPFVESTTPLHPMEK